MTPSELAKMIDHTALQADANRDQITRLCEEACKFGFGAICVAPCWLALCRTKLAGSSVALTTVVGFPHGNTLSSVKAFEAKQAIAAGAQELDMVMAVGALKSGDHETVREDIRAIVDVARQRAGTVVKVILETALLMNGEKVLACRLAEQAGADFVKTSTGFAAAGATVADVALFRRVVGNRLGVKAAGGIRDLATALAMIQAGADRLGCSASVAILQELAEQQR